MLARKAWPARGIRHFRMCMKHERFAQSCVASQSTSFKQQKKSSQFPEPACKTSSNGRRHHLDRIRSGDNCSMCLLPWRSKTRQLSATPPKAEPLRPSLSMATANFGEMSGSTFPSGIFKLVKSSDGEVEGDVAMCGVMMPPVCNQGSNFTKVRSSRCALCTIHIIQLPIWDDLLATASVSIHEAPGLQETSKRPLSRGHGVPRLRCTPTPA